ncbi:MAG: hypothetical protein ABI614_02060 [Planctomycetota bacterium]
MQTSPNVNSSPPAKAAGQRCQSGLALLIGAFAAAILGTVGCGGGGPPRAAVQGTVTWEGKPVEDGAISFIPQGEAPAASAKIVGGKYALPKSEGAILGTNRVEILGLNHLGPQEAGPPHPPGTMVEATEQFIPAAFNNASTLSVEITEGENLHDFALPN